MYRWLSIREKSIQCKIWRWKALLWRRMVCGSVTDIYLWICDSCAQMTMTIKTKLHTLSGVCEYNCEKALIIIISSLHSFLRFHKGDHVLIESRNDTHSRYVYSSCSTISCCVFDSSQSSSISFSSVHCKALILLQDIMQQFSEIICWSKKCLDLYNFAMLQP